MNRKTINEKSTESMNAFKDILSIKIQDTFKLARDHKQNEKYQDSIREYLRLLFLDRFNFDAYKELGTLYIDLGDLTAAIALFKKALQINFDPTIEDKLQNAILLRGQSLMEQADQNNFLDGSEYENFGIYLSNYLKDIQNLKQNNPEERQYIYYLTRSHCYCLVNNLIYGLQEIEKAIRNNDKIIEGFLLRGKILWAINKISEGNQDYWRAHSINPNHPDIVEFMKFIIPKTNEIIKETKYLVVQNNIEKCTINIKAGLEMYPNNVELLLIKSFLHRSAGEYEQALRDLDVCLNTKVDNQTVERINFQIGLTYNEMAMFLFKKKKYDDALTLFSEGIKHKPNDWGMIVNRGDAKKELGKNQEAVIDYEIALKLSNNRPEVVQRMTQVLCTLAIEQFNKKENEKALGIFDYCLKLSPNTPELLIRRGQCYLEMYRYQEALLDFKETVKYDPQNYDANNYIKLMQSQQQPFKKSIIEIDKEL